MIHDSIQLIVIAALLMALFITKSNPALNKASKGSTTQYLKNCGNVVVAFGILSTLGMIVVSAYDNASAYQADAFTMDAFLFLFTTDVSMILPFLILITSIHLIYWNQLSRASEVAILITSILITIGAVYWYWDTLFRPTSSTHVLGVLYIPGNIAVAIPVIYIGVWGLVKLYLKLVPDSISS